MNTEPYHMHASTWLGILSRSVQIIRYHRLVYPLWSPFATDAANRIAPHWLRLQAGSSGDCNQNVALAKI